MALAGLLASMIISGCDCGDTDGDGDAAVPADGGIRADGGDATVPPDGGEDGGMGNPDAEPDAGGDGGNTFAEFVKDLINNQTNETGNPVDLPNPDLPDNEDPAEYNDLFP
jgi:hypothetical protein